MSIWFKHDAHFHEHPKALRLRRLAGKKADSAEVGWYRTLAAAKRLGAWEFEDEEHLRDALGRYYGFVELYRAVGLLDDLTIHNADEYQAPLSPAERQRASRTRRDSSHVDPVTEVTPRVEQSRADKKEQRQPRARPEDGREDLEAFLVIKRRSPSPRQRQLLDDVLARHDLTGPAWAADVMYRNPDDPIGAVIEADKAWRTERIAAAQAAERPKPQPRRPRGVPQSTRELMAEWAATNRPPEETDAA